MKTRHIMLDTINDVKEFVGIVSRCEYEVDLISDRYTIDAKSIMGIFSLDLSKPIQMNVHADECDSFLNEISRFLKD
ncbi:MAG: HPr family phosphocarrier protein [Oscillospiraceae bacterium]|jgi:phosphocarrier protein HPr|nr:HPr family phosphocarrier protein [Oscillospiraceae bacterium]